MKFPFVDSDRSNRRDKTIIICDDLDKDVKMFDKILYDTENGRVNAIMFVALKSYFSRRKKNFTEKKNEKI